MIAKTSSGAPRLPQVRRDRFFDKPEVWHPYPVLTLKNGLRVANFSSPHPFTFVGGDVLPACWEERAKHLMLEASERETRKKVREDGPEIVDISINFNMTQRVLDELYRVCEDEEVDIVLVPRLVQDAFKDWASTLPYEDTITVFEKMRGVRVADRITKEIYTDRFCV